ncbi:Uncharacterised protein [Mycobacterium tuberculosis]|uniref:Uncharacterized protein n=2 Tax=Mycobacterium tuberculosis TaxID=1773 RepID=A0A655DXR9_MYCTX|nr:Uncharacterised protein [Mycobacterium tuberculosis]CNU90104.1 Uncharacterised protein [Mycobacterium tuberculosis]CNV40010.1 Uncharacterised protein [Mycobacterium tuberculosis]
MPAPPAEHPGGKNNPGRHHRRPDLHSNDRVDPGEPLAEIRGDCGGDMFDDLGATFGVCDEPNPQPVAVIDVLFGQRLGSTQRRAVHQTQRPSAASSGFQWSLTELSEPTINHFQQRVGHHRNWGVGIQQDADLDAFAGHDAHDDSLGRCHTLNVSLRCVSYCGHRPVPPAMANVLHRGFSGAGSSVGVGTEAR